MKKHQTSLLLALALFCVRETAAQSKPAAGIAKQNAAGLPVLRKNYFIKEYPQEYFAVQCGLEDREGKMWFGSGGNGIYWYDGQSFANFTHKDGLAHDDILCCMEDRRGNIWFGTRNGLIRYKPSGERPGKRDLGSFLILANTIDPVTRVKQPYSYMPAENFVWCIYEDRAGKIWFGTNKGVYVHDPATDDTGGIPLFTRFPDQDDPVDGGTLGNKNVSSIMEDKGGNLWFTSGYFDGDGVYRYDGKTLQRYQPGGYKNFRTIVGGSKGQLYFLSAFHGTFRYDGARFTNFTEQIGLKQDTVVALLEDHSGNFWFGMSSEDLLNGGRGGVWRYDGKRLRQYTMKDGLSHNCVFSMVEDGRRNIWFGTRNTGLCRFDGRSFVDFTDR